ncbi:MAG: hypothetical protein M0P57_03310 [Syntrophales bacterium]|jgi:hypothetical protein|nr:hypothetical protein [Syntrophales bacterium]MDY0043655.1 hypothetical protein [Syntrophales bacterium]
MQRSGKNLVPACLAICGHGVLVEKAATVFFAPGYGEYLIPPEEEGR